MKKIATLSTAALLTVMTVSSAHAGPQTDKEKLEGAAKFTAGAVIGGLVGGPIGAVVGAAGGGLFAEKSLEARATATSLKLAQTDLDQLEEEIAMQQARIAELEKETLARLELKVFFDTGVDQVSELDNQRLHLMADYLSENPSLNIRLEGHADPRGTDEYNNVLSNERALAVKSLLIDKGVADNRIQVSSRGANASTATRGDLNAYAQDRRVDITLEPVVQESVTQASW
jgi:outer membrane protein OmpA-like peptidoglycan-associated protein